MPTSTTQINVGVVADDGTGAINRVAWQSTNANVQALSDGVNLVPINAQTGTTYTLVLADGNKLVTCDNASTITVTVPDNSTVAFPIGTRIILAQLGAGQISVTAGGSALVRKESGLGVTTRGQYATVCLTKIASNTWLLAGNLSNVA